MRYSIDRYLGEKILWRNHLSTLLMLLGMGRLEFGWQQVMRFWVWQRKCPECKSTNIRKNGIKRGKQNHICYDCRRQFVIHNDAPPSYSDEIKQDCLKMDVNGMGFRAIERVKGVHHTTIINWVRIVGTPLPNDYEPDQIPQVGELDELKTFVRSKKTRSGCGQPLTISKLEF